MKLKNKQIGFVITGAFYRFKEISIQTRKIIKEGAKIIPIMSYTAYELENKISNSKDFISQIEDITEEKIIHTMQEAELVGTKYNTDIIIVAPASRKYNCKACSKYK